MGLTSRPESRGTHLNQIRLLRERIDQARKNARIQAQNIAILQELSRCERILHQQEQSRQTFLHTAGVGYVKEITADHNPPFTISKMLFDEGVRLKASKQRVFRLKDILADLKRRGDPWDQTDEGLFCPAVESSFSIQVPSSKRRYVACDYERLSRTRSGIECLKEQKEHDLSGLYEPDKAPSDNVPLFLGQVDNQGEIWIRFRPSLLLKRFEKWTRAMEYQHSQPVLFNDGVLEADQDDILQLQEEGDVICRNRLDPNTYASLCSRHRPRPFHAVMDDGDDCGGDSNSGTGTQRHDEPIDATQHGSQTHLLEPDFIVEELSVSDGSNDICPSTVVSQGTLKDMWCKLDTREQKHVISLLIKMLLNIWDNFDLLGGVCYSHSDFQRDIPAHSDFEHTSSGYMPSLRKEPAHCTRRELSSGSLDRLSLQNEPGASAEEDHQRISAAANLSRLEDEFMNKSFLDAFKAATAPMLSDNSIDYHTESCHCDRPIIPQGPFDAGRTEKDNLDNRSDHLQGSFPGAQQEAVQDIQPTWDNMEYSQRMTTTRARVQESMASKGRGCILPMDAADKQERAWMRQFDFSIDDVVIRTKKGPCSPESDTSIVGVSRWKAFEFGGQYHPNKGTGQPPQEQEQEQEQQHEVRHLASDFVHLLGRQSREAAEFMTDPLVDKERTLYHRWMAAWHERSPHAPKGARTRFELLRVLGQLRTEENRRQQEGAYYYHDEQEHDHDNDEEARVGDESLERKRLLQQARVLLRQHSQAQQKQQSQQPQPSRHNNSSDRCCGGGGASASANLKQPSCSRCAEERNEREMWHRDRVRFEQSALFLDEVQAGYARRRESEAGMHSMRIGRDEAMKELGRQFGLGAQWMEHSQALELAVGTEAYNGGGEGNGNGSGEDEDMGGMCDRSKDSDVHVHVSGVRSHSPCWHLSENERTVLRAHLFGRDDA
ncbi:hypothetical protein BGX28_001660 [Mortierella sp. GBA30]|nr:hypothetical protein BGX28_001660 [Mortierella sp. GBA30]